MSVPFVEKHIRQLVVSRMREGTRGSFRLPSNPQGKVRMLHQLEKGFEGVKSFVRVEDLFEPPVVQRHKCPKSLSERQRNPVEHGRLFTRMEASKSHLKTELNEKYWLESERERQECQQKSLEMNERVERIKSQNMQRNAQYWLVRVGRSIDNIRTASNVLDSIMRKKHIPYWDSKELPPIISKTPCFRKQDQQKDNRPPSAKSRPAGIGKPLQKLRKLLDSCRESQVQVRNIRRQGKQSQTPAY